MENNKEVKNIADHQEQHPVEAPPPQEYPPNKKYPIADNPLQPPESQRIPVEGIEEEKKTSSEMDLASGEKPEEWCCCCCTYDCLRESRMVSCFDYCDKQYERCCRSTPCFFICMCMVVVICICMDCCRCRL